MSYLYVLFVSFSATGYFKIKIYNNISAFLTFLQATRRFGLHCIQSGLEFLLSWFYILIVSELFLDIKRINNYMQIFTSYVRIYEIY